MNKAALLKWRSTLYAKYREFLKNGAGIPAARQLDARKALLDAYLKAALPQELRSNDYLRGQLFGSEGIPDTDRLLRAFDERVEDRMESITAGLAGRGAALLEYVRNDNIAGNPRPAADLAVTKILGQLERFKDYHAALKSFPTGQFPSPDEIVRQEVNKRFKEGMAKRKAQ